jgi:hypothetical protein
LRLQAAPRFAKAAGHPEWARFIALRKSPLPVLKPDVADPSDVDGIALMIRHVMHNGS